MNRRKFLKGLLAVPVGVAAFVALPKAKPPLMVEKARTNKWISMCNHKPVNGQLCNVRFRGYGKEELYFGVPRFHFDGLNVHGEGFSTAKGLFVSEDKMTEWMAV